ncbi:hypothetical protein V6617_09685 [Pelagibacterium nitratireducens]|jgi:hypothetical protein|uniref:DUF1579 domain-containing protein n=1 Tax=Pelagibacterium nitratireducens TaxID=1046114 RepID=A0ABZ2I2C7_9HYPH|nr:hypothetical protein [Pelagibacterium sp.]HCO56130.1 hypothetical protein [Pelagibacterium sp.]
MRSVLRSTLAGCAIALASLPLAGPALAAPEDIELLKSYVGEWRGRGSAVLASTGKEETVVCRMSVEDTGAARITFDGRCTLAGRTIAVAGTMIWNEQASQYEAAMSSVAGFQSLAIGRRSGDDVNFELINRNAEGKEYQIEAAMALQGARIGMDLQITDLSTGGITTAQVPFSQ